ncbi:MAG: acetyl-CoA decarbonylase/synthase complex subunit gamma, partial [Dehalococcoidia bacterium]
MALTGIEIFKLLPKTNCKDCGEPTCLAFAMKLAAGKAELSLCPHVSEESKAKLSEASAPPIIPVTIGVGDRVLKVGGETVMFRHEKRFENPPGIAILASADKDDAEIDARLKRFNELQYERIGLTLRPDLVAVKAGADAARFKAVAAKVKEKTDGGIILISDNPEVMTAGLSACADRKPLLYAATEANMDKMAALAKENSCPLAVKADSVEKLAELTAKLNEAGVKELVIDSGA